MLETGKIIKTFQSRKGIEVVIRYPKWEDLEQMLRFINELSAEDTYILFSGEQQTKEQEAVYLGQVFSDMEFGKQSHLLAFSGDKMIGGCGIIRRTRRMSHMGDVHLSVTKGFREEGIGTELLKTIIEEGKKLGLKILAIQVFANNEHGFYVYKKVGFKEYGRVPKAIQYKGELVDEIELAMEL